MKDLSFTSMVCSRILHDMAGPIGAVMNGTELLEDGSGVDQNEIIDLLKASTEQLTAYLQVFRIAFGALSTGHAEVGLISFQDALDTYAKFRGFKVTWSAEGETIHKELAKIILNGAFVLGDAVRKKGSLQIQCSGNITDHAFSLAAVGKNLVIAEELSAILEHKASPPYSTENMCAYIIRTLAADLKIKTTFEITPEGIMLRGQV